MDVPKWTIQCYLKWVWPRVTFLMIFLKPAIRLSSALIPLVQSCTQNMSRESTPIECSAWAGVWALFPRFAPVPFSPQNLEGHPHTHHCRCGLLGAPYMLHRCTTRDSQPQRGQQGTARRAGLSEHGAHHLLRLPESGRATGFVKLLGPEGSQVRAWGRSLGRPRAPMVPGPNTPSMSTHSALSAPKWEWPCQSLSRVWLRPHGLQPARLPCPRGSPGRNTAVGWHFLLQGIFPTQGPNSGIQHCSPPRGQTNGSQMLRA